jgi:hypothetical protein
MITTPNFVEVRLPWRVIVGMDRQVIERIASTWKLRHPDLTSRLVRATGLVDKVKPIGDLTWEVIGVTATYYVYANPEDHTSTCTCRDSRSGHRCKHRLAVALVWMSGRVSDPVKT